MWRSCRVTPTGSSTSAACATPTGPAASGRSDHRPGRVSAGPDGDHRPGPEVDAVTVVQGYPHPGSYLGAVDHGAVLRPWIDDRPATVRLGQQRRVHPRYSRVGGRAGQIDLGFQALRCAAPPDPHLRPGQPEPALGAVVREGQRRRVRAAGRDHVPEVVVIAGHHRRPYDRQAARGRAGQRRYRLGRRRYRRGGRRWWRRLGGRGRAGPRRRDDDALDRAFPPARVPARIEVEPAGLAEPARLGRPAVRAGLGRLLWLRLLWLRLQLLRLGAGGGADPHPAHVAEVTARGCVTGRTGRPPLLRLLRARWSPQLIPCLPAPVLARHMRASPMVW